jgi:hypothetical protein
MKNSEFIKLIKKERSNKDGIVGYITYTKDDKIWSNFISDCSKVTDDNIAAAVFSGHLVHGWATY